MYDRPHQQHPMQLIAAFHKLPNGRLRPQFYCGDTHGKVVRSITDTLLDLITESGPDLLNEFESLLRAAEDGSYQREKSFLPDWGINDKCVWVGGPEAEHGHALISNENIGDLSMEHGTPARFSMAQIHAAIAHWRRFEEMIRGCGEDELLGKRYECWYDWDGM